MTAMERALRESPSTSSSHRRPASRDYGSQESRSPDDLGENLLGELTIEPTKVSKPEKPFKPLSIRSIATGEVTEKLRLVIGIDYGTTFTGGLKHVFVAENV